MHTHQGCIYKNVKRESIKILGGTANYTGSESMPSQENFYKIGVVRLHMGQILSNKELS